MVSEPPFNLFDGRPVCEVVDDDTGEGWLQLPNRPPTQPHQHRLVDNVTVAVRSGVGSRGSGFVLRDLRTGDRHTFVERTGSLQARKGMLFSTHLLGAGGDDDATAFGEIDPIPDHLRDATLAMLDDEGADAFDIVEVYADQPTMPVPGYRQTAVRATPRPSRRRAKGHRPCTLR